MKKSLTVFGGLVATSLFIHAIAGAGINKMNKTKYIETSAEIELLEGGKAKCTQTTTRPELNSNDKLTVSLDALVARVVQESGCISAKDMAQEGDTFSSDLYFKIHYRDSNDTFATIKESSDSYLGGAHPNTSMTPHILDLKTQKEVSSDSLFEPALLTEAKAFIAATYAEKAVSQNNKHIDRTSKKLAIEKDDAKTQDLREEIDFAKGCNDLYQENSTYFDLSPSKAGFLVSISLPHVAAACDRPVYISYQEIMKKNPAFLSKTSVISNLIKK
jgi:hypothetical protein